MLGMIIHTEYLLLQYCKAIAIPFSFHIIFILSFLPYNFVKILCFIFYFSH